MSQLVRFSVSLESELLERFDRYCAEGRFATRSEAIRQLLRETLTQQGFCEGSGEAAATLTLVYDHHRVHLSDKLTEIQHAHPELIVSTTHVHLTHSLCLEVIILQGPADRLQAMAAELRGQKGIQTGQLVLAMTQDVAAAGTRGSGKPRRPNHPAAHSHPHSH